MKQRRKMKQSWPHLFISSNKVSKWICVRRLKFSSCRSKGVSMFSLSKWQKNQQGNKKAKELNGKKKKMTHQKRKEHLHSVGKQLYWNRVKRRNNITIACIIFISYNIIKQSNHNKQMKHK